MRVRDVMEIEVKTCRPEDTLADAGRTMAEAGCGVLPVVDDRAGVIGMVTDRDVCLGVARADLAPSAMKVGAVMSPEVHPCHPWDDVREALASMRRWKVRRLPVVDEARHLVGLLALDEVVLRSEPFQTERFDGPYFTDIATTLRAICERPLARMA